MAAWNVDALSIIGHRRPKKLIILMAAAPRVPLILLEPLGA